MKVISIVALVLTSFLVLFLTIFYFSNKYQSAFEADQQCHSEIFKSYSDNKNVNCDHDLETRQWILFEKSVNEDPAIVLGRFRY